MVSTVTVATAATAVRLWFGHLQVIKRWRGQLQVVKEWKSRSIKLLTKKMAVGSSYLATAG